MSKSDVNPEAKGVKFSLEMLPWRWGMFVCLPTDKHITGSIKEMGEYTPVATKLLMALAKPGSWVIDAGANMGAMTIPLGRAVGEGGRVLAIEPQPIIYRILQANIAINDLNKVVQTARILIDEEPGSMKVPVYIHDEGDNFGGYGMNDWVKCPHDGVDTPIVPLDKIKVQRLDLIKGDIEGAELGMLKGGKETIAKFRPILFLENNQEKTFKALMEYLWEIDYDTRWFATPHRVHPNYYDTKIEQTGEIVCSFDMLCVPKEKKVPMDVSTLPECSLEDSPCSLPIGKIIQNIEVYGA